MSEVGGLLFTVLLVISAAVISWVLTRQAAQNRLNRLADHLEAGSPLFGKVSPSERRILETHARTIEQLRNEQRSQTEHPSPAPTVLPAYSQVSRVEVLLGQFSATVSTCFTLEEVHHVIHHFAPLLFPSGGQYSLLVPGSESLRAQLSWPDQLAPEMDDLPIWPLSSCAAALHHKTLLFTQAACLHPGPPGATCLPVTAGGQLHGVLSLNAENEVSLASRFTDRLALTFDRLTLLERLAFESDHDALTGLPNRRKLLKVLEHVEETTGALLLDIDHFKRVNDTHGHGVGDEVLKGVASRLAANIRGTDLAGRLGGEEFLVLLLRVDESILRRKAEEVRLLIAGQPFLTSAGAISLTVSIGAALSPAGTSGLIERADVALYQAKERGRNQVGWSEHAASADD